MILQMKRPLLITFGLSGILSTFMQGLACVVVTSRFTFALARDYGVPFATTLFKTNRWQEPWVSDLVVVMCLYASIAGLYVPKNIWDNLTQTLMMWYMPVVYVSCVEKVVATRLTQTQALTLILYLFSNLDLASEGRSVFTLRRWSKPFALFNVLWLTVACIQGCFPYAQWLNSGTVGSE
jgi:amino acid transporter